MKPALSSAVLPYVPTMFFNNIISAIVYPNALVGSFILPVLCRQGNFRARRGNKCFFLSSEEPNFHLPSTESQFRYFPSPQTTATGSLLTRDCRNLEPGDTMK